MPDKDVLIPVGKIIGTHGIKGQLKVYSFSGNIESLNAANEILVRSSKDDLTKYKLKSVAYHAGKFNIALAGLDDINNVQHLIGTEICLWRSQLPEPETDEYYWCDLIGLEVSTVDGQQLGKIFDIFETGSSDIYVVRSDSREYLIPAIADVITSVDLNSGRMTVTPLEGLLDL